MTSAWEHARSLAEQHAGAGGVYVRLANNGDKIVGVFCGEPHAHEVHWTGEQYEECTGRACTWCGTGKRPSLRVALNFFVPTQNSMRIIEGGTAWFKDVVKVRDKYGLDTWQFEIERHGESGDPKTTYSVLPDRKIDPDIFAKIQAAKLNDLVALTKGRSDSDSVPF